MSELVEQITQEIDRIKALPLAEQPAEYAVLRELLESTLNAGN